jgi:hypothetical protein
MPKFQTGTGATNGYPRFLCELLESCPVAHEGVHPWLFRVARYLHRYHTPEEIFAILERRAAGCGRPIEPHEIVDAVKNSGACKWEPSGKTPSERRAEWNAAPTMKRVPEFDPDLAIKTAARIPLDITPEWLKAHSRAPVDCSTAEYLQSIFEPREKALVFSRYKSQGHLWPGELLIDRFSRRQWPEGAWFLCNPIDGQYHWNPRTFKESRRSEESVISFRYAVLECDHEPKEKWFPVWLKILAGLPLPIVSITDSAGISAHALVRVSCESKQAWDQYKREILRPLVPLGADDSALTAVRLTRLPGCYRGDRRQELLYLNPNADGTPIFQQKDSL